MDIHQKLFNKIQQYLIYGLILILPLTHKEAYSIIHPDLVWSKFLLGACAVGGLIIFIRNRQLYLKNIYFRLLSIYLAFQVLSLFRSQDMENSLLFIGFYVSIIFLFVYVYDFVLKSSEAGKDAFKDFIKFYLISFTFVALFLIRQIYLQENFQEATGGVWPVPGYPTRYGSTFWDVNHFGIYLVSLFLLLLGYLFNNSKIRAKAASVFDKLTPLRARIFLFLLSLKGLKPQLSLQKIDRRLMLILIIFLAVVIWAFTLTGSRSSLFGFGAGLVFFAVGYFFFKKRLTEIFINYKSLSFIAISLLLPVGLMILFKEEIRNAFLYRAVSFYAHLFLLKVGILTGLENFFLGIGVNAFSEYFKTSLWADSYYYIDKAALNLKLPLHNLWLEAWVETGVFSFMFFALLWGVILTDLYKVYKQNRDYLALGLASGIMAFLVGGMFYSYKSEFFWLYAVLGFVYASVKKESNLHFDFHFLKSFKPWVLLLCGLSLIFPLLFFTMPPTPAEIFNYYNFVPDDRLFTLWAFFLDNFRYIIGNYSFTGRFLMVLLYLASMFSTLSLFRKLNVGFLTSLLSTTVIFLVLNFKIPLIMVSYNSFLIYLSLITANLIVMILPIKRKLTADKKWINYLLTFLVIGIAPFSIASSIEKYDAYDTNLNFLIELASNRSKTNDALIFIEEESLTPLVKYYADRLEDDESGRFYMVDSYVINLSLFKCGQNVFKPGVKYLFLVNTSFECPELVEDAPNVSIVKQGDFKLIMYEEKIRHIP